MSRPTVAEVDLQALNHNWHVLSAETQGQQLIPVIKADAYGHDVSLIVSLVNSWQIRTVAVAMVEEAIKVKQAGFAGYVIVLGPIPTEDLSLASQWNVIPMISDKQGWFDVLALAYPHPVHIKWNTGMNRLGLDYRDLGWFVEQRKLNPQIRVEAICTHLLHGDDLNQPGGYSQKQIQLFQEIERVLTDIPRKHIFNSDSFILNKQIQFLPSSYGARPGIALYGYPSVTNDWSKQLKPVMTLKTKIIHLTHVAKGEAVSYNATWLAPKDSLIAVLPIGYADGYSRHLSNKGQVFIRGVRVPLVGIVCMDYLMIDVTGVEGVSLGDDVELWGNNISLADLARKAGTIPYELLTALTARVPRRLKTESQ